MLIYFSSLLNRRGFLFCFVMFFWWFEHLWPCKVIIENMNDDLKALEYHPVDSFKLTT